MPAVGPRERKARGMAVLEQLEMADEARNKAINLSGWQKRRVVIARALVNNPKVVFADEPTGNLDTATGRLVEDILFPLNQDKGMTLGVVTHDTDLAARCDRQMFIRDGREVPFVRCWAFWRCAAISIQQSQRRTNSAR
jgi:putative ABC transport system ATP-binding protein